MDRHVVHRTTRVMKAIQRLNGLADIDKASVGAFNRRKKGPASSEVDYLRRISDTPKLGDDRVGRAIHGVGQERYCRDQLTLHNPKFAVYCIKLVDIVDYSLSPSGLRVERHNAQICNGFCDRHHWTKLLSDLLLQI